MNGLTVFKPAAVAVTTTSDDDFNKLAGGFSSLPRMSLMTSNSTEVKNDEFPINTYALKIGETLVNLGKNVDVVVAAYRLTAIWVTEEDGFCSSHEVKSDLFQEIMKVADTQGFGSGAVYGPEFLFWIPSEKKFATFLCGSKSARNMAAGIKALVGEVATMGSQKIETPKYTWFAPSVAASNTVVTEVPEQEVVASVVSEFINDKGRARELASGQDAPSSERE